MNKLKIINAKYYDPDIGEKQGTDVTAQLSAEIVNENLFYNGRYNNILPDNFKTKHKKLKIKVEYRGKIFTKFYNEDEKINLPNDLGKIENQFLKNLLIILTVFIMVLVGTGLMGILDLNNPWVIGLGTGIIADIMVFTITKKFS